MQRRDEFDGSVNVSTTVNIVTSVPGSNHSFPKFLYNYVHSYIIHIKCECMCVYCCTLNVHLF